MKKNLLGIALITFSLGAFAQSPRLSLFEEFTGETCPPCAATNPALNAMLAQPANTANCVAIKWQVPIPSAPSATWSLYQTNKSEIDWRYLSYGYGINSAPSGRMDGQSPVVFGAASDHPVTLTSTVIATAQSFTSAFNITMTRAWEVGCNAITLTINIQATASFSATGNLIFRTVMVEKDINFATAPGSNGEKDFYDTAIRSFPSIQGGVSLPATWTNGQTQTFTLSCAIPAYTRKKEQVAFVGFIQDDGNRKVAQAARTSTAAVPSESLAAMGTTVDVTCSNVITPTISVRNSGTAPVNGLTITPYTDGTSGTPITWPGTLAPGASTTIVLTGVTTSTLTGTHTFSYEMAMSAPLYNLTTTNNKVSYLVASSYQTNTVTEGFATPSYPPAGWTQVNMNSGPSWSRNNFTGGYNKSFESTKYDFYMNTAVGDKDELYLPPTDLSATTTPFFSMDYAYAQRNASSNDKLEVMVSDNCGASWTTVFSQSGSALSTYDPISNVAYVPDPSDANHWKTATVSLTGFNKPAVIVKLVVTNDHGNNLYIDNINLLKENILSVPVNNSANNAVLIYPNPAGDVANIRVPSGLTKVSVVNLVGQVVYETETAINSATVLKLNTKDLSKGLYSVIINNEGNTIVKKLIVTQ